MPNVYCRLAKINNVIGRSDYISNEKRQEEIVLHKQNMLHSWKEHSSFEKNNTRTYAENREALEVHIALPNELYEQQEKLENICDDLSLAIVGKNKDYEYAVHWNKSRTNLHVHILFSERENQTDLEPKVYKKDIWMDKDTHQLAKAGSPNAELIHKKGDIQTDKDGNIKYQTDIFKAKDTRFKDKDFVSNFIHDESQKVFKKYNYEFGVRKKDDPYLSQKKWAKGKETHNVKMIKVWNKQARQYNDMTKQILKLSPPDLEVQKKMKKNINKKLSIFGFSLTLFDELNYRLSLLESTITRLKIMYRKSRERHEREMQERERRRRKAAEQERLLRIQQEKEEQERMLQLEKEQEERKLKEFEERVNNMSTSELLNFLERHRYDRNTYATVNKYNDDHDHKNDDSKDKGYTMGM